MRDVKRLLEDLELGQYYPAFEANDVDIDVIGEIDENDLKELGVASLGHRRKLLAAFRDLAARDAPADEYDDDARAERREVTAVFADLTGYTKLSRELDAEDLHSVLTAFYDEFNAVIGRLGGTVNRHIGDCVMAVFGAPISHGNDAERALRTTTELHRVMEDLSLRFGRDLSVHIGVAAGNVLFSPKGYGERKDQDFTLTGDKVNFAARLADLAKGGETLIDDSLFLAMSHKISCDAPTTFEVKGFEHPMLAHRFLEFRDHEPIRRLIGRDAEMATIRQALAQTTKTERGQTLFLSGDAGMGKSRLLEETMTSARAAGYQCHSTLVLDFGLAEALSPINGLVKSLCGLGNAPEDSAIENAVARLSGDYTENDQFAIFLTFMLGGTPNREARVLMDAMSDAAQLEGQQSALKRVLRTLSAEKPLLLAIEDLHWASDELLPSIDLLIEESARHPILLMITSRPEGPMLAREIADIDSTETERHMKLGPMTEQSALELAMLSVRPSDQALRDCVLRAQGNPLYLEQLLRHVNEENDALPGSIQSLIQNRFDKLVATDRRVLQAAAVLGQRFSLTAATEISGVGVHSAATLVEATLIRPVDQGYLFDHALIRDAVLQTMLRDDRRAMHRAAATWFETRDPLLYAQHLGEANDPQAAAAFLEAARGAEARYNKSEALSLAEKGLAAEPKPAVHVALLCLKGNVLRETGQSETAILAFEAALKIAPDAHATCRAQIGIVSTMRIQDRIDEAYALLDDAQALAEQDQLIAELSEIHYFRGSLHFPRGNLDGCLADHAKSLAFAKQADLPEQQARALSGLGDAHYARGAMFTAHTVIEDCLKLCDAHGFGAVESANRFMLATVKIYMNQTTQALNEALRSADLAAQVGLARPEIVSRLTAGWILTSMAEYDAAREQIEKGLSLAEALGAKRFEPFLEETLARIAFATGAHAQAAEIAEKAHEKVIAVGAQSFIGAWVLSTVALTTPDPARRSAALAEGEAILASGAVGHNYFRFYRNGMQACLNAEDWDEALRLADALAAYTTEDPTPWSDFHIDRTRALVASARGEDQRAALAALENRAKAAGLLNALQSQSGAYSPA